MSRIDDLKKQNPQLNISLIDIIASVDPTSTYKYTSFMIKALKNELESDDVKKEIAEILFDKQFIEYINRFEKHCVAQRIRNNDITKYKSIDEIIGAVKEGDEILKQKEGEKQIIKLYDKDGYIVLIPLTFEASKTYGANTKWCITQKTYWKDYQWKYRIIYIIDKNKDNKYAISRKYDDDAHIKGWTLLDKEISPLMFDLPEELIMFLMKMVKKPQFEIELGVLGENNIFNDEGFIIPIENASRSDLDTFKNRFGTFMSNTFREKLGVKTTTKSTSEDMVTFDVSKYLSRVQDTRIINTDTDNDRIAEIMRRLESR